MSGLTTEQLLEKVGKMDLPDADLADMFGVTVQSIWNVRSKKRKKVDKNNDK